MNEKLIEMIVELARSGGSAAVWLYAIHVIAGLLKYVVGFGFIAWAIRGVAQAIRDGAADVVALGAEKNA